MRRKSSQLDAVLCTAMRERAFISLSPVLCAALLMHVSGDAPIGRKAGKYAISLWQT